MQLHHVKIETTSPLNVFSAQALEKIFLKIGGLKENTFVLHQRNFTDGTSELYFDYPVETSRLDAIAFIQKMERQLQTMTFIDIIKEISAC